jgi:Domain of unknown function (DUF397)
MGAYPDVWRRETRQSSDQRSRVHFSEAVGAGITGRPPGPDGGRLVRDTKDNGRGPILRFTESEWRAFVLGVRDGEFG